MKLRTFVTIGMMAAVGPLAAQEAGMQERLEVVKAQLDAQKQHMVLSEKIAVEGLQQRMAVEARFTPGAPYSGEAVNESLQVLADGNRITKKTVTRIYRDSEGRTRREVIGTDGQVDSVNISDPVAGTTYVLEPRNKAAYRNGVVMVTPSGVATATFSGTVVASKVAEEAKVAGVRGSASGRSGEPAGATVFTGAVGGGRGAGGMSIAYPAMMPAMAGNVGKTTTEDLGQQVVEGVMATGSRSTTVIEAGAIGNEQPIQIVSEQWMATDLKLLVMTKHSDPRSGDSTYRLTNITQAEQPRSLFELPPDYTLKESTIRQRQPAKN